MKLHAIVDELILCLSASLDCWICSKIFQEEVQFKLTV